MSEYSRANVGKLRLKGQKSSKHRSKHKNKGGLIDLVVDTDADATAHGGWWSISSLKEITGSVAIEFQPNCYVKALDSGLFVLGGPHRVGEGPEPEEVLTAVPVSDIKIALKSGYGKYLRVNADGRVTGRSDAIGALEQWEPIFQDGKLALLSCMNNFMGVDDSGDIVANSKTALENGILKIRSITERVQSEKEEIPVEEKGSLKACEVNYTKKFQSGKMKMCEEDMTRVKRAKKEGKLHEELLDRRSKLKSDKFCK